MVKKDLKKSKQKPLFSIPITKQRRYGVSKRLFIELLILIIVIVLAVSSSIFQLASVTMGCGQQPFELISFGDGSKRINYRYPGTKGYGYHPESKYYCTYDDMIAANDAYLHNYLTSDAYRAAQLAKVNFTIYVPDGYKYTPLRINTTSTEVSYILNFDYKTTFDVTETTQSSYRNYANLCSMPEQKYWYGLIIGKDGQGRNICREVLKPNAPNDNRTTWGINTGQTGITIRTVTGKNTLKTMDNEATGIFSAMKPHVN